MKAWVRRKDLPNKCYYSCDFCYDTLYCLAVEGENVVRCSDVKRPDNCPLGILEDQQEVGTWEVHGVLDGIAVLWKCSACGTIIYSEDADDRSKFHKYCGCCGAKMEEQT